MYLRKVTIENVPPLNQLTLDFTGREAGWHVIIGNNGTGKTRLLRIIALSIIRSIDIMTIPNGSEYSNLKNEYLPVNEYSVWGKIPENESNKRRSIHVELIDSDEQANLGRAYFLSEWSYGYGFIHNQGSADNEENIKKRIKMLYNSFFIAFGPVRALLNEPNQWDDLVADRIRSKRLINLFYDNAGLYELYVWLKDLEFARMREIVNDEPVKKSGKIIDNIKKLLNPQTDPKDNLLPYGVEVKGFDAEGQLLLKDGYDAEVRLRDMSAGYRSILALVFTIIRHMIDQFGVDAVFKDKDGDIIIDCEGVVLIDEIDAHLHPTWQTRIGQWFTKFFPKIQFIVTTHSPLICRACEKGSIWRLAAPGSEIPQDFEVKGTARDRLIYGNILDAYGTEVFGEDVSQSEAGQAKAERIAQLKALAYRGKINDKQRNELEKLVSQTPTSNVKV